MDEIDRLLLEILQENATLSIAQMAERVGLSVLVSVEAGEHTPEWLQRFNAGVAPMSEVLEVYRMAGDVDYMLRVAVADMAEYDAFYKRLIAIAPMKNVTSRFAMERMKHTTAYPLHPRAFRDRRVIDNGDNGDNGGEE